MAISTNGTVLARLAGGLYNTQMSNATYSEVKTLDPAALANTLYARDFASSTDLSVATTLVTNLGLSSVTGLANWVAAQLTAAGSANKGAKIVDLLNGFAQLTADTTYGAYATAFNTKVDAALVLSQTTGNAGGSFGSATTPSSQTFTLTTGVDTSGVLKGDLGTTSTAGDDYFIADNSGTNVTSLADNLNGGAGNDTITFYGFASGDAVPQMTSIETAVMNNSAAGSAISFANSVGLTSVTDQFAVGASTITVGAGVAVTLQSNADATTVQTVNYDNAATSASLTLNGFKTNTTVDLAVGGTKLATLNLATKGASSTIGNLNGTAALTKVVIAGDKDLTVTDALEVTVASVDASALTGKLSVKTTNKTTTQDDTATGGSVDLVDVTIIGGSGNDTINVASNASDNEISVDAGAGDDKVVIAKTATATLTKATATNAGDSINGGSGNDTLSVNGALSADLTGVVSGFEILETTADATQAMATNKLGITQFTAGDTVNLTLTGIANNSIVTLSGTGTGGDGTSVDATIGTDTTADSITVNLQTVGATTTSAIALTNIETLNLVSTKASTDASTVTNTSAITASDVKSLVISGTQGLTIGSSTLKAAATVDASALTGKLTATFASSVKSYVGSSGADDLTVKAGDLKQGNTFAGGLGTDKLTVTATQDQNAGILAASGFETIVIKGEDGNNDTFTADFRNVTDLTTLKISAGANAPDTDNFTLNRISDTTVLTFDSGINNVVTSLNTGTTQKVAFSGNYTVASFTADAGATTLTVSSSDGDTTADEAGGVFTSLLGTSLTSIILDGLDRTNLGTLGTSMTSVDASASKGGLTVTASATATSIVGSQAVDTIIGGGAADTIQGGKGADVLNGGAGADSYVFEATAANNGIDLLKTAAGASSVAAGSDKLNFKNFLNSGSVDQNGGVGTAIVAYGTSSTSDVDITNKVVLYTNAAANGDYVTNVAGLQALIQGAGTAFNLSAGGKAIILTGDAASTSDAIQIWYVDDSLDGVSGTVSATDCVSVGVIGVQTSGGQDLDTLTTANFAFA
jgi:hypothetical protein